MTHRVPPEFEPEDDADQPVFAPPDPTDVADLICWSGLPDSQKNWTVRQWTTKAWPSLVQFCRVHNLNYRSVYEAFARRDLPTIPVVKYQIATEAQNRALNELLDNSTEFARTGSLVCHRLMERLTQYDCHSVKDLLGLAHNVSALAEGFADTAKKISEVATDSPTTQGSAKTSLLPDTVKARLVSMLRAAAEGEVRENERREAS